jgi:protein-S-isoprenylcysteine O-methyltransferase Ste14
VSAFKTSIFVAWGIFWVYWLISAVNVKQGSRSCRARSPGLAFVIIGYVLVRVFRPDALVINSPVLRVVGAVLFVAGLALAVWARIFLGRNWGMPMSVKAEPELVTSGPYRLVRHPIYSGILLATIGTALATNLYWLALFLLMGSYFIYSATVEERLMTTSFPDVYPAYKAKTKMLIPFVL